MASGTRLSHRIFIDAPPDIVWAAIADLEAVQEYNPGISKAALIAGPREGIGAGRTCLTKQGEVVERIVAWEKPNAIEMQLVSSPWPIRNMRWRTEVSPKARGTQVSQELTYAPSLGVIGGILNALMMRRTMDKAIASVFDGLKAYCEKKAKAHG
jgi:ribosome-associated toxin RatA of RatAB toxin-antitoxin module